MHQYIANRTILELLIEKMRQHKYIPNVFPIELYWCSNG